MPPMLRKGSSARSKRILADRGPKTVENEKNTLIIRGPKCPAVLTPVLQDLHRMAKPNATLFSRKHEELSDLMDQGAAREDGRLALERLMQKCDSSLAIVGTRTKKRPQSLTFARTYEGKILDMAELLVVVDESSGSQVEFTDSSSPSASASSSAWSVGAVPIVVFQGSKWQESSDNLRLQSLLLDIFGKVHHQSAPSSKSSSEASASSTTSSPFSSDSTNMIDLKGVEHAIVISWLDGDGLIDIQAQKLTLLKSGTKIPCIKVDPSRPHLKLRLDRVRFASEAQYKTVCRLPAAMMPISKTSRKNLEYAGSGSLVGRLHLGQTTDLSDLQTRKMKGLRKEKKKKRDADDEGDADKGDNGGDNGGDNEVQRKRKQLKQ